MNNVEGNIMELQKTNSIFQHEVFGQLTTITNEKGEIYFIGKEVCEMLEYSNTSKTILDHCKGYNKTLLPTNGGEQEVSAMLKLGYGRNTLFSKLRNAKILMKDNLPYVEHINSGRFLIVETKWLNPKTQISTVTLQTRCTQKGLEWLQKIKDELKL